MIITIDGLAGSGKSTAAQDLAEALGFELMNTGAMYRATGLLLLEAGFDIYQESPNLDTIEAHIADWHFHVTPTNIQVNGVELSTRIQGEALGKAASRVGLFRPVRRKLQAEQRRIANDRDIICEGRDQGSVVFPDAPLKFFFTASAEVRAARRVTLTPGTVEYQLAIRELADQLERRDQQDRERELDPLVVPLRAVHIDTTTKDRSTVLTEMLEEVAKCRSPK